MEEAITVAESVSALVAKDAKIAKIPKPDLVAHLAVIKAEGLALPFDVRAQLLQRRVGDLMVQLLNAPSKEAGEEIVAELVGAIAIWNEPGHTCDDSNVKASDMWCAASQSISSKFVRKIIDEDQSEAEQTAITKVPGSLGIFLRETKYLVILRFETANHLCDKYLHRNMKNIIIIIISDSDIYMFS